MSDSGSDGHGVDDALHRLVWPCHGVALLCIGTGMSVPHPRRLLDFAVSKTIWGEGGRHTRIQHTSGERSPLVGTLTVPSPASTSRVQVWQASSSEPLWTLAGSRGSGCVRGAKISNSAPWQPLVQVLRRGRELEWTCDLSGGLRMLPMHCATSGVELRGG